jgi:hypothetical protein
MIHQRHIKYKEELTPLKAEDLDVGVECVHISENLTQREKKDMILYIDTIRAPYRGETLQHYEEYKRIMKRYANEGLLFSLEPKKKPKKGTSIKKDGGLFD